MGVKNKRILILVLFLFVGLTAAAQPPGSGLPLPVDGGIIIGMVVAIVLGTHKIRNNK